MKKILGALGACVVLLSPATMAAASGASDFKATVTLKTWYNSWKEKDENFSGDKETRDFGSALMVGPALTLRYSNVVFGASYLMSAQGYEPDPGNLEYDRRDLDLTLTYMFVPGFGVFAGYKSINSPISVTDTGEDFGTQKITGPGLGVTGSIPLGQAVAIYGNLAGLYLKKDYDTTDNEFNFNMFGVSGDLGVAYAFNTSISATFGLKGQYFSGKDDEFDLSHSSTFLGLTLGLNYTF